MKKPINRKKQVMIEMPMGLYKSLKWLSTQTDSKGNKHSLNEIVVGACNLYLLGIQTYSEKKKDTKKMN